MPRTQAQNGITPLEIRVLEAFLADPGSARYGFDLMRQLGMLSGSLYPALGRLRREGYLLDEWEQADRRELKRPRRHHFRLNPARGG